MDNATPPSATNRKPSNRSWLAIVAICLLLVTVPATRWIVVQQAQWVYEPPLAFEGLLHDLGVTGFSGSTIASAQRLPDVAASHPRDYEVQLACILVGGGDPASKTEHLRSLIDRFPGRAPLYAHVLCYSTDSEVRTMNRHEGDNLSGGPPPKMLSMFPEPPPPTSADLASFDKAAAQGERLDPDNAFFPQMRAVGLFASHRDAAAIAELEMAGRDSRWDDYTEECTTSAWRLNRDFLGNRVAIYHCLIQSSALFPHFAIARAVARQAIYEAIQTEQLGHPVQGVAIRHAVMSCGGLMRAQSSSAIGSLVGIAFVSIAMTRPGGGPEAKPSAKLTAVQRVQQRQAAYLAYLRHNGLTSEASWVKSEITKDYAAKDVIRHIADPGGSEFGAIFSLIGIWLAGLVLMANIQWYLLNGVIAKALSRGPISWPAAAVLILATLVLQVFIAVSTYHWGRDAGYIVSVFSDLSGALSGGVTLLFAAIFCFVGTLALPLVSVLVFIVGAIISRMPPITFIATWAPRVALALLLCYIGLIVLTAQQESVVNGAIDQVTAHEGSYIAQTIGRPWPGVTR